MNRDGKKFLLKVLGADGVQLLTKASEDFPELSNVFLPRIVVSWLQAAQSAEYEGRIPGLQGGVTLRKSEPGMATVGGETYVVDPAKPESLVQVAAAMAVAMGADQDPIPDTVQPEQVWKLAKSLDLLVKSKTIAWLEEESAEDEDDLEKGVDLPGKAAAPRGPEEPEAPQGQKKQPGRGGAQPGMRIMRSENFSKALLKSACSACGKSQLHPRWNTFEGCDCISALVKSEGKPRVDVSLDRQTYRITADSETILMLQEIIRDDTDLA
jgi:hypothetical protein